MSNNAWPRRSAIEEVWRHVISGEMTREAAHNWAVPWVEFTPVADPPEEGLVEMGLQYVHGLDMTADLKSAGPIGHGGPEPYILSDDPDADALVESGARPFATSTPTTARRSCRRPVQGM